ncbi:MULTISPECIES: hypothetical protein [unclassified Pseudomonas]|uniref:hypothetical protein n=1 Tax=unclassified Pseudomonas TaxID=196821 RepID=UPI000EFF3B7C|nr:MULTISPECIES: hypothetical protein [unclassified Pseudomonas]RMP62379.1 hypothetical protein ALQ18_01199 [Pseudomonas marginalis pv. marginalis]
MPTENKLADPFGPHGRTVHIHLSVRGAIRDFSKRQLTGLFRHADGTKCTADEAIDHLLEALAYGKEVLPFGPPCEGFDFSGKGCPGHDNPPTVVNAHDLVTREEKRLRPDPLKRCL